MIHAIKKGLLQKQRKLKLRYNKKVYVSFGENCLTDDILSRHRLKSFSTPYSSMAVNVEYILQIERDHFNKFLDKRFLEYHKRISGGPGNGKLAPLLTTYSELSNRYMKYHENGFEFSHHDVIGSKEVRETIQRRVDRVKALRSKKKFIIFYHHRLNKETNIDLLLRDLSELVKLYSTGEHRAEIICFTQKIVNNEEDRAVERISKNGVHYFVFNTLLPWTAGNDFWAKKDNDLIKEMIGFAKGI